MKNAVDQNNTDDRLNNQIRGFLGLWPFVLGLAFSRAGIVAINYGSYIETDAGIFSEKIILASLLLTALALPILFSKDRQLGRSFVHVLAIASVLIAGALLAVSAVLAYLGIEDQTANLALGISLALFGRLAMFYWLRRLKGMSPLNSIFAVFTALALSEVVISLYVFLPDSLAYLIAAVLMVSQLLFLRKPDLASRAPAGQKESPPSNYFEFARALMSKKQFLFFSATGIGLTSIVIGFLRGYPNGMAIAFTAQTRIGYVLLTVALCVLFIVMAVKGHHRIMSLGIWITLQLLASLALFSYAAFPADLQIGAVFTTTMNAMMLGFAWYTIIAFSSLGFKDPYYYAIFTFMAWISFRAFARVALYGFAFISGNTLLVSVLIGVALLLSAQIIYMQYIGIARSEAKNVIERFTARKSAFTTIMGLDEHNSMDDIRKTSMVQSAKDVGKQFLLSEREIEVLSLYALGFTQRRVAEELHVSQSTVHTHIKRIYAKTDIHSRQALLDYIKEHAV